MILQDPMLWRDHQEVERNLNAEWALEKVLVTLSGLTISMMNILERSDVGCRDRLQRNLLGRDQPSLDAVTPGSIVVRS